MFLLFLSITAVSQTEKTLSTEEKLYELSMLWKEASYNFAFFDQVPNLNWDSCYQDFIPLVMETKTDWEHYSVLKKFIVLLEDGHTRLFPPAELRNKYYGTATKQIVTRLIENQVIITEVLSNALDEKGIKQGMEIVSIDDIDVYEYAEKYVKPYMNSSTQQDLNLQTYGHFLLSGSVTQPVIINVRKFNGEILTHAIHRKPWLMEREVFQGEPFTFKILPKNIAYLKIHNFVGTEYFKPKFDSIYAKILNTEGLIIDVRDNFGGSTPITHFVLKHFAKEKFKTVDWKSPMNIAAHKAWGDKNVWYEQEGYEIEPFDDRPIYTEPVNVLCNEGSFSGAEDFCLGFLTMKRGKLVGGKTAGSSGSPIIFNLPGGALALICTKKDFFPDGTEFIGYGINPDIEVNLSIEDVINDIDKILNVAVNSLSSTK
jgi:C-terminal processing protease CtpA/Prc